jgi:hypothetical protein
VKIIAKLTRLASGDREQKSAIRRAKRRNRIIQWILWSPRNGLITGFTAGVVVAVGLIVVLTQYVYDYQVADMERSQQAAAAPAEPTLGFDDYGLTKMTETPTPTGATPAPTTTTPVPQAPAAAPVVEAKPATTAEEKARATAQAFIKAWLAGPTADSQQTWLAGLKPTTSTDLLALFELTDRTKIPTGTSVTKMTSVTVPGTGTAHVSATMKDRGVLGLVLESDPTGAWKVVDVAPEDHE